MRQIKIQNNNRDKLVKMVSDKLKELPEEKLLEIIIRDPKRTSKQNQAVHQFFTWIADMLNDNNMFLSRDLLKEGYEAEWTSQMVKEIIWRPTQRILTGKKSTTKLSTKELTTIADTIQQGLAKKGLLVEFPSIESFALGVKPYEVIK